MLAVLFRVAGNAYALPCRNVLEVLPRLSLHPAARAPAWLTGTFDYRGALVPVIDACQLLAGYPCGKRLSSRMAIVRSSTQAMGVIIAGVLAERMTEVRLLDGQALIAHASTSTSYFGSVIKEATELVQLIDVDGLVGMTCGTPQGSRLTPAGEQFGDLEASALLVEGKGFDQD